MAGRTSGACVLGPTSHDRAGLRDGEKKGDGRGGGEREIEKEGERDVYLYTYMA